LGRFQAVLVDFVGVLSGFADSAVARLVQNSKAKHFCLMNLVREGTTHLHRRAQGRLDALDDGLTLTYQERVE
jgi:hypothetical protein